VIIAEAQKRSPQPERLQRFCDLIEREFLRHMAD
jgi:hypothetical protein